MIVYHPIQLTSATVFPFGTRWASVNVLVPTWYGTGTPNPSVTKIVLHGR